MSFLRTLRTYPESGTQTVHCAGIYDRILTFGDALVRYTGKLNRILDGDSEAQRSPHCFVELLS